MKFDELRKLIDGAADKKLRDLGFNHKGVGLWSRHRHVDLNVIELQKHSENNLFCVNLGVHYDFLPKSGSESPIDAENVSLMDCDLRFRLTDKGGVGDQWWPIAASSADVILDALQTRGMYIFDIYKFDRIIPKISIESLKKGDVDILSFLPKIKLALLLSRIYDYLGLREECVEAARFGIEISGMAVGPRKALKAIIKKNEDNK